MRGMPKLVLGGLASHVMWSFTGGVMIRPDARIGTINDPASQTAGTELQLGAAIAYASFESAWPSGPSSSSDGAAQRQRLQASTTPASGAARHPLQHRPHPGSFIGGGIGVLRQPGTPMAASFLRLAYAPMPGEKKPEGPRDPRSRRRDRRGRSLPRRAQGQSS